MIGHSFIQVTRNSNTIFLDPSHSQASLQSKLERAIANACSAERGDLENNNL